LIPGTYRSFGNDGLHFNEAINLGDNFYYPDDVPRSNAIADALHDASDHIPVVAEYQLPARMVAAVSPSNFGKVIQGADHTITYIAQNTAPFTVTPIGADLLEFTVTGSGAISGQAFGTAEATLPPVSGQLPINTANVGSVSGTVTFSSDNLAVQNPTIVRTVNGTVVRPASPSFADDAMQSELTFMLDVDADSGTHVIQVPVYNFGFDAMQALLNVNSVEGATPPFSFVSGTAQGIGASPTTLTFAFDTTGLADGKYDAELTILASDENLPGASNYELDLLLTVMLGDAVGCEGDLNGDGVVNVSDLLILLGAWGSCPDCDEDLNGDDVVNVSDLLILLGNWGLCP